MDPVLPSDPPSTGNTEQAEQDLIASLVHWPRFERALQVFLATPADSIDMDQIIAHDGRVSCGSIGCFVGWALSNNLGEEVSIGLSSSGRYAWPNRTIVHMRTKSEVDFTMAAHKLFGIDGLAPFELLSICEPLDAVPYAVLDCNGDAAYEEDLVGAGATHKMLFAGRLDWFYRHCGREYPQDWVPLRDELYALAKNADLVNPYILEQA